MPPMFLAVAKAVAVVALPVKAPTKALEVMEVAAVTVPRLAIVVPLKVEFFPNTILSLPFVVTNFIYEAPPSLIFNASAKLSVRDILFSVVLPPKSISSPTAASSTTILSQAILPTLVIFPSLTSKLPVITTVLLLAVS